MLLCAVAACSPSRPTARAVDAAVPPDDAAPDDAAPDDAAPEDAARATPPPDDALDGAAAPSEAGALDAAAPLAWVDHIIYVLIPGKFDDADPTNDFMKQQFNLPNPSYQGGFLGGDLAGVRRRVPYLKSLGCNAILLYPIFKNDTQPFFQYLATGYRVSDWQAVDPNFGTLDDLTALVGELHSTVDGPPLRLILDLPIGMTGLEHPWLIDQSQYPYYFRPWGSENIGSQPINTSYGPVDDAFALPIINHTLDPGPYPYLRDQVLVWLAERLGVDGFRYDSAQNFHAAFWQRIMPELRARTRADFTHLAEVFAPPPLKSWQVSAPDFMNSIQMDGVYDFALLGDLQAVFAQGGDARVLERNHDLQASLVAHPEQMVASVDNYEAGAFLKVATGASALARLRLALGFLLTVDRVPLIYSGNEYGIDYSTPGALFAPGLNDALHQFFLALVRLRAARPELRRGGLRWLSDEPALLAYARTLGNATTVVVINLAGTPRALHAPASLCAQPTNLLDASDSSLTAAGDGWDLMLGPLDGKIFGCP
jgi:glycosidase